MFFSHYKQSISSSNPQPFPHRTSAGTSVPLHRCPAVPCAAARRSLAAAGPAPGRTRRHLCGCRKKSFGPHNRCREKDVKIWKAPKFHRWHVKFIELLHLLDGNGELNHPAYSSGWIAKSCSVPIDPNGFIDKPLLIGFTPEGVFHNFYSNWHPLLKNGRFLILRHHL